MAVLDPGLRADDGHRVREIRGPCESEVSLLVVEDDARLVVVATGVGPTVRIDFRHTPEVGKAVTVGHARTPN
jgi:hypothetical protein